MLYDREIIKAILSYKQSIVSCFMDHHPTARACIEATCHHDKVCTVKRIVTVDEDMCKLLVEVSPGTPACVYSMGIIGHLMDHDYYKQQLDSYEARWTTRGHKRRRS